jgi:hypothetical protein
VKTANLFGVPLALVVALCAAQTSQVKDANSPQLKLEVIPLKTTYRLGERPVMKYRLTSLVDGALCFPRPAVEVTGSFEGYLTVKARRQDGIGVQDLFIKDVWPGIRAKNKFEQTSATAGLSWGCQNLTRYRKPTKPRGRGNQGNGH